LAPPGEGRGTPIATIELVCTTRLTPASGGAQDVARAFDGDGLQHSRVHIPGHGRGMEDRIDPLHGLRQALRLGDIANGML
jgi:hypothetical protein